jgi:hypothetical protein
VDIFEIPIGKFIVSLGLLRLFVVEFQMPFAVLGKTVQANEFIFLLCRRPVPASCIALVEYKSSFVDKLFSLLLCLWLSVTAMDVLYQVVGVPEGGVPVRERVRV